MSSELIEFMLLADGSFVTFLLFLDRFESLLLRDLLEILLIDSDTAKRLVSTSGLTTFSTF